MADATIRYIAVSIASIPFGCQKIQFFCGTPVFQLLDLRVQPLLDRVFQLLLVLFHLERLNCLTSLTKRYVVTGDCFAALFFRHEVN